MTDRSRLQEGIPIGWRIFAGAAAVVIGSYSAVLVSHEIGLRDYLRDGGVWDDKVHFAALAWIMAIVARPGTWRQLVLLLSLVGPLAFWFGLADHAALLAQVAIARERSFFILFSAFAMLAVPAFAAVLLVLQRAGMVPKATEGNDSGRPVGMIGGIAIALPGVLAATLLGDVLRAFAWLPADPATAMAFTIPQIVFAAFGAMGQARIRGPRQWVVFGSVLAAAMVGAVLAGAAMEAWAGPLDTDDIGTILPGFASIAAAFLIGWAARAIGHRLAGRDSPWQ